MSRWLLAVSVLAASTSVALGEATIPKADRKGTQDSPLLKRYEGSLIVASERKSFDEFRLPLSKLVLVPDKKDSHNNRVHEPRNKKALEGRYTRLVYLIPEERSPLEVIRNYQDEIKAKGGRILFECKGEECGGDPLKKAPRGAAATRASPCTSIRWIGSLRPLTRPGGVP